jgi:hypothetical protein
MRVFGRRAIKCAYINDLSSAETSTSVEPIVLAQLIDFDSLLVVRHEGNAQAQRCITISDGIMCIAMPAARFGGLTCGGMWVWRQTRRRVWQICEPRRAALLTTGASGTSRIEMRLMDDGALIVSLGSGCASLE